MDHNFDGILQLDRFNFNVSLLQSHLGYCRQLQIKSRILESYCNHAKTTVDQKVDQNLQLLNEPTWPNTSRFHVSAGHGVTCRIDSIRQSFSSLALSGTSSLESPRIPDGKTMTIPGTEVTLLQVSSRDGKRVFSRIISTRHAFYNRALPKPKKIVCEIERFREKETFFKGISVERSCKNC